MKLLENFQTKKLCQKACFNTRNDIVLEYIMVTQDTQKKTDFVKNSA